MYTIGIIKTQRKVLIDNYSVSDKNGLCLQLNDLKPLLQRQHLFLQYSSLNYTTPCLNYNRQLLNYVRKIFGISFIQSPPPIKTHKYISVELLNLKAYGTYEYITTVEL
jgi:hypothetical protein